MKNRIIKAIDKFDFSKKKGRKFKWNKIYTYSQLRTTDIDKMKDVTIAHNLTHDDEVLVLVKNGRTDKDSLVLTADFISIAISNWFSKNQKNKIYWSEISIIKLVNHLIVIELKSSGTLAFEVEQILTRNKENASDFVRLLNTVLDRFNGIEDKFSIQDIKPKYKFSLLSAKSITLFILFFIVVFIFIVVSLGWHESKIDRNIFSTKDLPSAPAVEYDTLWSDIPKEGFTPILLCKLENVFYEPYNITVKSSGFFTSTGTRVIIPINIPDSATYWIYRLRLLNAKSESRTRSLADEIEAKSVKKYKIFGANILTVENSSSSMVREILNTLDAPSKEKAYSNVYFITKEEEALNFQNNIRFDYDINFSIKNTHSRNGLINYRNQPIVYLGIENETYKDNIYVWLEVVAFTDVTKYFKVASKV